MIAKSSFGRAVIAAAAIAGARSCLVFGFGTLVGWREIFASGSGPPLVACVGAATFAVAFVFWRLFTADGSCGPIRGAAAGFLTGIVSHPVTWIFYWTIGSLMKESQVLDRPELDQMWRFALRYSAYSLIFFGVFTVVVTTPTGAIVGYLMSNKRDRDEDDEDDDD